MLKPNFYINQNYYYNKWNGIYKHIEIKIRQVRLKDNDINTWIEYKKKLK